MNEQAIPPEADEEHILKAALSTAFSPTHSPRNSLSRRRSNIPSIPSDKALSAVSPVPVGSAAQDSTSQSADDSWKSGYEAQVESWRAQSAEAREKAEKERKRWEDIRAAEKAEADLRAKAQQVHDSDHGWETVGSKSTSDPSSSQGYSLPESCGSPDARDLVLSDAHSPQVTPQATPDPSILSHSRRDTADDSKLSSSQKWEDLHSSQTSSFPSLSFPDNLETPSPEPSAPKAPPLPAAAPFSATLSVFDTTLPTRTRVSALFSSLAINMLLPFINGVMLGFGEIFAKNVAVAWFGWKIPGTVATNVGVGVRPIPDRRRRM